MQTETGLLQGLRDDPQDDTTRAVYADWLEEQGDMRAEFLRLQLAAKATAPDSSEREAAQQRLRELRPRLDHDWLQVVEPLALLGKLTQRAQIFLATKRITTVGQLCDLTDLELLTWRGFGETLLREVREKLARLGLCLRHG
jgi:uncharacterized protein (TIGR02996 family)